MEKSFKQQFFGIILAIESLLCLLLLAGLFSSCTIFNGREKLPDSFYKSSTSRVKDEVTQKIDLNEYVAPTGELEEVESPYKLGRGDILRISIYGQEGGWEKVRVRMTGNISYPRMGIIKAAGKTIPQLRAELQKKIDQIYNFGKVVVVPQQFSSRNITILGQVNHPGVYPFTGNERVVDAICLANGFGMGYFRNSTIDMHDLQHAVLIRDNKIVPVDFEALVNEGDGTQNRKLKAGDIIHIPSALKRNIYVLGEVDFPRSLGFYGSLSLIQAISEARGFTETAGDEVIVVRGNLSEPSIVVVNYKDVLEGKAQNILLKPNDIVYVPKPKWKTTRALVKMAIRSFVGGASSEAASQTYQNVDPTYDGEEKPIVIQQ